MFAFVQNHDGLVDRWKGKRMENLLELHNKTPVWNDGKLSVIIKSILGAEHSGHLLSLVGYPTFFLSVWMSIIYFSWMDTHHLLCQARYYSVRLSIHLLLYLSGYQSFTLLG